MTVADYDAFAHLQLFAYQSAILHVPTRAVLDDADIEPRWKREAVFVTLLGKN